VHAISNKVDSDIQSCWSFHALKLTFLTINTSLAWHSLSIMKTQILLIEKLAVQNSMNR